MRKRMYHEHQNHEHTASTHGSRRGPGGHGRGRGGGGGRRASRGAVAQSILVLLGEQPRHGYELITALEERSGGRWRPSPGAVYPALTKLVERGLIRASTSSDEGADGKTRYELTETGRTWVDGATEVGFTEPWAEARAGRQGDLHRALGELVGPVRQIARFGTSAQAAAAEEVVKEATAKLYTLLATPPTPTSPAETERAD
ncbi:MAG TPA: PadR family transcriptional regulator [Ilumatobacter sp.]|nr:PadR family transcriptional regulator [Ilumatobacter sp.]